MQTKDVLTKSNRSMHTPVPICVAEGDGIGREIMAATLRILEAAGAALDITPLRLGREVYLEGIKSGIPAAAWADMRRDRILLKGPITTPQGGGYKSLNVTLRKTLGLFANVRPVQAYTPYVDSRFANLDMIIVRENEEDLYAGIEHQQTAEVVQCLKLVSRPGCERVIRYAFEYARAYGRRKVTCMTKDNIMKQTDGLFHQVFDEVAAEYPDIQNDHFIIDIGAALLADQPERFDVVVTLNLYGDIISDIVAQIGGSVGLAGSANVGEQFAMFEAIHGSAPDIAGRGIANPSGLLQAACMMLVHIGQADVAERIQNAWLRTLEDGIHTADIVNDAFTRTQAGTHEFAEAVIARLGQEPTRLKSIRYGANVKPISVALKKPAAVEKRLVGVDIFLDWNGDDRNPEELGRRLEQLAPPEFQLKMITNRGVKVYPGGLDSTFCTDHWRCRFVSQAAKVLADGQGLISSAPVTPRQVIGLLSRLAEAGLDVIKTENLYEINGERAYSLGQGE